MHQLSKDPEQVSPTYTRTSQSVSHGLDADQLHHYLDYCSEMLSLTAKTAALCAEHSTDEVVLNTVSTLETLTTELSNKIWQKISLLPRPETVRAEPLLTPWRAWVRRRARRPRPGRDADRAVVRRLVLGSALMLFLELALIRWLGSNIVHLSYFSNFVLLGSFLGIGIGFLVSRRSWSLIPLAPLLLALLVLGVAAVPGLARPHRLRRHLLHLAPGHRPAGVAGAARRVRRRWRW